MKWIILARHQPRKVWDTCSPRPPWASATNCATMFTISLIKYGHFFTMYCLSENKIRTQAESIIRRFDWERWMTIRTEHDTTGHLLYGIFKAVKCGPFSVVGTKRQVMISRFIYQFQVFWDWVRAWWSVREAALSPSRCTGSTEASPCSSRSTAAVPSSTEIKCLKKLLFKPKLLCTASQNRQTKELSGE